MENQIRKRGFVLGLILILIGAIVVPSINAEIGKNTYTLPSNEDGYRSITDWWVMFRHDANHSGYSSSLAPQTNNVLWTFITGLEMSGSPSVVDGKVYIGSWDKKIYCLDAITGEKLWEYITGLEITSSPAIVNGKVYIGSNDGKVYCLDASTGEKLWDYQTGADVVSSPTIVDGNVYVGSRDHKVYCLNAETGTKIWDYTTNLDIISSPAVSDGHVFIGSWDDKVYCLNAETGAWIWDYTTGNDVYSSPAVVDNKVYIGSSDYKLYCLDAQSGSKLWDYTTGGSIESCPAITNGKVYVGSFDNKVYCLNTDTGEKIWDFQAGDYFYCSPAIADGRVYTGSFDHKIYSLNAETGALIWSYTTGNTVWSSPAVAEGNVFIGSGDHKVYCFRDLNSPPNVPVISGPTNGTISTLYTYTVYTYDPEDNDVSYYINWGDGSYTDWIGPYPSGQHVTANHSWDEKGSYMIQVKARDTFNAESDWSVIQMTIITPILTLSNITGGIGRVSCNIKNIGDADATNVLWTISLDGKLVFLGKESNGTIDTLAVEDEEPIKSMFILGFGKTNIIVSATCDEGVSIEITASAFILGPFVLGIK